MVHDPEKAASEARKEVRFRTDVGNPRIPKKNRRSASIRPSTAALADVGADDEDGAARSATIDDFKREVTDRLGDIRYRDTYESLQQDAQTRIAAFAEHFARKTNSKKPGMPLDVWVEDNRLPVTGVVDVDEFAKLVAANPHEVFREVKLRSLLATALSEQVKELHMVAQNLDDNLKNIHDWIYAIRPAEPERQEDEEGAPLPDREEQLVATVASQSEEIVRLKADAVRLNEAIAHFVLQNRENTLGDLRGQREGSVFSQSGGGKRSSKQPDPPIFYNEPDRDT
jgi:hypothetical protein